MSKREEDRKIREEQKTASSVPRFRNNLDSMSGRWLSVNVAPAPDGGLYVDVVKDGVNGDRGHGETPDYEGSIKLRESVAVAMAKGLGVNAPQSADGAPPESESPKTMFHIPPEKLASAVDIVNQNIRARSVPLGLRQDPEYGLVVMGVSRDKKGRLIDPEPSRQLLDDISEARMTGLGMAPSDPEKVKEFYAKKHEESKTALEKIEKDIAERHDRYYESNRKSLGLPAEGERETAGNSNSFALERMFRDEMAQAGKLDSNGKINWAKVEPRDMFAAIERKVHSESGVSWKTDKEIAFEENRDRKPPAATVAAAPPAAAPAIAPASSATAAFAVARTEAPPVVRDAAPARAPAAPASSIRPSPSPSSNPADLEELTRSPARQNPARVGGMEGMLENFLNSMKQLLGSLFGEPKGLMNSPQASPTYTVDTSGRIKGPASTPVGAAAKGPQI